MSATPRAERRPTPRARAHLVVGLVLAVVVVGLPVRPAGAEPDAPYRPPVDAPVSDPFRPPAHPYGPGNRGLEYDTAPGTPVRAAAGGEVTFAGSVAGTRHVTVLHPDGLRTTASRLATVAVVVGQRVRQGDLLGTTEGRLHFGARSGDAYLDPAALFAEGPPQVRLVPFDLPPGVGLGGERSAIRQLLGLGSDVAGWVGGQGEVVRTVLHYAPALVPSLRVALLTGEVARAVAAAVHEVTRPCTSWKDPTPVPGERRLAVLVAGLGSTSTTAAVDDVDAPALGYEAADTVRFSYAGGRTPGSGGDPAGVPARHYDELDSQQDLRTSAARLADLVEALAARDPGVPVDLLAHSQGGLVSRLAVAELDRRGTVGALGLLATMATPHHGADIATMGRLVGLTPVGAAALDAGLGDLDPSLPAIRQLSEASDLVRHLSRSPLPEGLEAISVAGRADAVVPVPRTRLEGAASTVVPVLDPTSAHRAVPGHPDTTRAIGLALAGRPPACRNLADALADHAVGGGLSALADGLAPWVAGAGLVASGADVVVRGGASALAPTSPRR